jgi:hypothetical protein
MANSRLAEGSPGSWGRYLKLIADLLGGSEAEGEETAGRWSHSGDDERAELERRNVKLELEAAQLERDRAALERKRPFANE